MKAHVLPGIALVLQIGIEKVTMIPCYMQSCQPPDQAARTIVGPKTLLFCI